MATAPIQLLAWEPPYTTGAALKRQTNKQTNKQTKNPSPGNYGEQTYTLAGREGKKGEELYKHRCDSLWPEE